jgi:formate dehydrogenase iron-sulfur subunit
MYSRRQFLRRWGLAAAGAIAGTPAAAQSPTEASTDTRESRLSELAALGASQKAMLFDATLCVGCRACELACNEENQLGRTDEEILAGRETEDARALAPDVWTYVTYHEVEGDPATGSYGKVQCMHCIEPACVSSCPVVALEKTAEGPVIYHPEKCLGCRYCELACPFLVPRFEWDTANPYIRKCDMCWERQREGESPACVEVCPTGALITGTREELLNEARRRIIAAPRQYVHHIFGEKEAGGTNFLHLASRPFDELGYRQDLPYQSYRDYTHRSMLSVPYVLSSLAISLGAVAWAANRRRKIIPESPDTQERGT